MTEWITDRRPLPVDANDDDFVRVQIKPESDGCTYIHRANVGLGTPWRHCRVWRFPDIRAGQVWRCEDGKERVVEGSDSNGSWLIGEYWYTSDGAAPGVPRTLPSVRLAELINPKPNQIPPAILSGAEAFYVLVSGGDDSNDVKPFVFETVIEAGSSVQAALDRRARVGSRYGTTYVAQCRIVPFLTAATPPNSEAS